MRLKIIVLDASVFIKLFIQEQNTPIARVFIKSCVELNVKIIVPDLFRYEVYESARRAKVSLAKVMELFEAHERVGVKSVTPNKETWLLAEKITQKGHEKSGYPSLYDSIYQALAIQSDTYFITSDKKHYAKTKEFGHIKMLEDWEELFVG